MKKYIDQIFYEGLGKTIYYPIEEKIIKKINNKKKQRVFTIFVKSIYFIIALLIAIMLFYFKL